MLMASCQVRTATSEVLPIETTLTSKNTAELDVQSQKISYEYVPTRTERKMGKNFVKRNAVAVALEKNGNADVLVNPTWQDNYPTVNMESIACGTPVVTYRTGGSVESVTAGTGFVVEQGDVSGIMQAVRQIESSGKEVWREHCRRYALEHFRKQDRYADYVSLYEELTMNRRS